jgi:hypothetical protein
MKPQKNTRHSRAPQPKRKFSIGVPEKICKAVDQNAQELGINGVIYYQKWIAEGAKKELGVCLKEA